MRINKFSYPVAALEALPKNHLSAFLLLGLFLNDTNWLRKLLLYATQDESGGEAEGHARLALSLMVSKLLATKIHEGWLKLSQGELGQVVAELPLADKFMQTRAELARRLQKGSVLHQLRLNHGAHYPSSLVLDGLPGIAQSDVALYVTAHAGDALSLISELCAAAELKSIVGMDSVGDALAAVLNEVVSISGLYSDYLNALLVAFLRTILTTAPTNEVIDNNNALPLEEAKLRFFVTPPGAPNEQ
jgi:hypothetical protein